MGGSSDNDVSGSDSSSRSNSSANDNDQQSQAESFDRSMSNAERPDRAPVESSDTSSTTDTDNSPNDTDDDDDRSMTNDERPDRAPAGSSNTSSTTDTGNTTNDTDDDDDRSMSYDGRPDRASAATTTATTESTDPEEAPESPNEDDETDEEDDRSFIDQAGDFFSDVGRGMQDFARDNPRVDSYGTPVGLVDADGIQRGEVASRVRSSGTSSEDLADQLGFSSLQDMAAAQNTDFIEEKFQEDLVQRRAMEEAINGRYGTHPQVIAEQPLHADQAVVQAGSTATIEGVPVTSLTDDFAKYGFKTVTKALGPLGILIDVVTPIPIADGTLVSQNKEASDAKVEGVLEGSEPIPGKRGDVSDKHRKSGGKEGANKDFDDMDLNGVRDFEDSKGRPGRYGFLDDGRKVTVRETSSDERPTLEIDPPQGQEGGTKIRYDD